MPVYSTIGRPTHYPVANCNALAWMAAQARTLYSQIAQNPVVMIDSHARTVMAALTKTASERAATVAKLEQALGQSGATMIRLSRKAVVSSADLFLAVAVQTRNPQLIATATGIDMVVDTAEFVIQIVSATDGTTRQEAAVVFLKDRFTTVQTLVSGPGRTYSQRQFAVAKALADTMKTLGEAVVDEVRLRAKLEAARDALKTIETQIAGLPVNHAEWQQFMLNRLDAEIFIFELLQSEYAGTGCRIDGSAGPAFTAFNSEP